MKALKFVMITAILSFAVMSYADNVKPPSAVEAKITKISLRQALTNPQLVSVMYQQLTPAFLMVDDQILYHARVKYKSTIVEIYGPRDAWLKFFSVQPPGWTKISNSD